MHGNSTLSGTISINAKTVIAAELAASFLSISDTVFIGGNSTLSGTLNVGKSVHISKRLTMTQIAIGTGALWNDTGTGNFAIGSGALSRNTTGNYNFAIGGICPHGVTRDVFLSKK